jgi:hypothetical protein
MWNMKTLPPTNQKLWSRLKFCWRTDRQTDRQSDYYRASAISGALIISRWRIVGYAIIYGKNKRMKMLQLIFFKGTSFDLLFRNNFIFFNVSIMTLLKVKYGENRFLNKVYTCTSTCTSVETVLKRLLLKKMKILLTFL